MTLRSGENRTKPRAAGEQGRAGAGEVRPPGVLYISYDGMLEPLGQSQVLSYLEHLAPAYRLRLISFEKRSDWDDQAKRAAIAKRIADAGIHWIPLRYHKAPSGPATAYDVAVGTLVALWQVLRHRLAVVHARSYVAALMAVAVKRLTGVRFLFDMRGFWADERVDGGIWPAGGRMYRGVKALERKFLLRADHVISLTHAAAAEIRRFPYLQGKDISISVIPTCADLARFRPSEAAAPDRLTIGYVGAVGTWQLFDEVLACFRMFEERDPEARLLVVNRGDHAYIAERLDAAGIAASKVEILQADHKDVPALVSRMSVGTALRKPQYSQLACAPTKLAEYLGCGIPCLANYRVGDVEDIVEGNHVGVVLNGFSEEEMRQGVDRTLALLSDPGLRERCVATARRLFALEDGAAAYMAVYRKLTQQPCADRATL